MMRQNRANFSPILRFNLTFLPVFLLHFLTVYSIAQAKSTPSSFPLHPVISNNVAFWEKVYSVYSTSEAIIHDQNDLTKIYEIVPIRDYRIYGSSGKNRLLFKKAKKRYEVILRKLAKGKKPATKAERKVAAMYKNTSKKKIKKAAANVRIQIGQKERFREGVTNSGPYMEDIKNIFRAHDLPIDLAYLPHVESSFNNKAYSKQGAAGIWQFTRSTGRHYLRVDYVVDERLDPIQASRAAARFLKKNYDALQSWPLAITAYNYGAAGMQRALGKHGNYETIFKKYNQGHFKFASRNFYPEFLAAKKIAKKLEKNKSVTMAKPKDTVRVKLKGFISVTDVLHHFQIDISTLKLFNPSLRHPVLTGKKYIPRGFNLKLPAKKGLADTIAALPKSYYKPAQKRSRFHQVRRGETAGKIARIHKISLRSLLAANNLKKTDIIYAGKRLRIPSPPGRTVTKRTVPVFTSPNLKTKTIGKK